MSKPVLIWRVIRIVDRRGRHVIYEKVYVAGKSVMSRTIDLIPGDVEFSRRYATMDEAEAHEWG